MAMPHTITPLDREQYQREAVARAERNRVFAKLCENEGNEEEKKFWLKQAASADEMAVYWSKTPEA